MSTERITLFLADGMIWLALALIAVLNYRAFCSWQNKSEDRRVKKAIRRARRGTTVKLKLTGTCGKDELSAWLFEAALSACRMLEVTAGEYNIIPPYRWLWDKSIVSWSTFVKQTKDQIRVLNADINKLNVRLQQAVSFTYTTPAFETDSQLEIHALKQEITQKEKRLRELVNKLPAES